MKYSCELDIDLPRQRVIELFDNADNMVKWQEGLVSFDHLEGEPGQPGAKSNMVYQMGKRKIEMVETITKNALPEEFNGTYDAQGVHNILENRFIDEGEKTKWIVTSEFQFKGFMKVMSFFMKGAFPKQTRKFMVDFKNFAEGEGA